MAFSEIFSEILPEAAQSSKAAGSISFAAIISVIAFSYFKPGYIPSNILGALHVTIVMNSLPSVWFAFRHRKVPTVTSRKCPICLSFMAYSELKCPNRVCGHRVEIPTLSKIN